MPCTVIDIQKAEDVRDVVHRAVQALAEQHVVAFPTETVYGLAASARHEGAIARLIEVKHCQEGRPLTLAVKSANDVLDYVPDIPPLGWRLARRCWPGPVTLVLDGGSPDSLLTQLSQGVRNAVMPNGTVGFRVPAHTMILDVLRMVSGPVVLTSANQSGQPDATTAADVVAAFGDAVPLVLDDGPSRYGQPSSVVRASGQEIEMLREGVVPTRTMQRLASYMVLLVCTGNTCRSPMAEGLAKKRLAKRIGCQVAELEERGVIVLSAGLAAMSGSRPSPEAVGVMREMEVELSAHESQPVTEQLVRHADVILTMTAAHRHAIVSHWPDAGSRTRVLCGDHGDIADPIGGSVQTYRQCALQIEAELQAHIEELDIHAHFHRQ